MASTDHVATCALLSLSAMGPARFESMTEGCSPAEVWQKLVSGGVFEPPVRRDLLQTWRDEARKVSLTAVAAAYEQRNIRVHHRDEMPCAGWLRSDPEPPAVLFARGVEDISQTRIGIVGTRRCTSYGKRVAFDLGAALAAVGVSVVSGLALGIDAAAHRGALSTVGAPPVAVVGSGLDVVYPRANSALWEEVALRGLLLSEAPLGARPERWRFPARNRIIAGMVDALVVVESHDGGGSLITVDEALTRDVEVWAVPGPVTSNASIGTNRLIADGAHPLTGVDEFVAHVLGFVPQEQSVSDGNLDGTSEPASADLPEVDDQRLSEGARAALDALGWSPVDFEQLLTRTGRPPGELSLAVEELIQAQRCGRSGVWLERIR